MQTEALRLRRRASLYACVLPCALRSAADADS